MAGRRLSCHKYRHAGSGPHNFGPRACEAAARRGYRLQVKRIGDGRCDLRRLVVRKRSFLGGHLLFNVAPGADFETAANPAQRFGGGVRSLRPAYRALRRLFELVGRHRPLCMLQDLGRYDRIRLALYFPSHTRFPPLRYLKKSALSSLGCTSQAAIGTSSTQAASSFAAQRGHFWPGTTRGRLFAMSTSAGTACVHIGQ